MGKIGQWVLEQVWADPQRWPGRAHDDRLAVTVNVSGHELMAPGFASRLLALVNTAGVDPGLLTVDVTESSLVADSARAALVLDDLKKIGVTVALDSFGTGSLSLLYLSRFPIDVVKIDRTIIAQLGQTSLSAATVRAVVQITHEIGMTVVAEGVETAEQYQYIDQLGCQSCQGYYIARPMPRAGIATLIEDQRHVATRLPARSVAPDDKRLRL